MDQKSIYTKKGVSLSMMRNEKGQFVKTEKNEQSVDEKIAEMKNELAKLEKQKADTIEAEKREKSLARKNEASVVEQAINAYEQAKATCNETIKKAYDEYAQKVQDAEKMLNDVEKDADTKLNAWLEAHPGERFHYSYKSPDGKITREYNYYNQRFDVMDQFKNFQEAIKKLMSM